MPLSNKKIRVGNEGQVKFHIYMSCYSSCSPYFQKIKNKEKEKRKKTGAEEESRRKTKAFSAFLSLRRSIIESLRKKRATSKKLGKRRRMVSANREMVVYCFDTLVAHYNNEQPPPPEFDEGEHPLFVTWKKVVNGGEPRLRGCIGTLEARHLINGFKDYALTSALRDRRFSPIQPKELPQLECTVSILINYETAVNYLDWEVGKHGMIIEFTDPDYNTRRSATYLPEVASEQGWTKIEAIDSLMRKAGYNGAITESLRKRIRMTRYESTLFTMSYSDYVTYVRTARGTAPIVPGVKP